MIQAIEAIIEVNPATPEGRALVEQLVRGEVVPIRVAFAVPQSPSTSTSTTAMTLRDYIIEQLMQQYRLSEQEANTVVLAMDGKKRSGIAEMLQVSPNTVTWYWGEIYSKMSTADKVVRNQSEVFAEVRRIASRF